MSKPLPLLKLILLFLLVFNLKSQLLSQDVHFSQQGRSPLNINPALTGMFRGDTRFVGNYRTQWQKVPVNYVTFSGSVEQKFINTNLKNSLFAAGLQFNHDEAGDLDLSTMNLGLSGAYTQRLAEKHFITGGLQIGGAQRRFDISKLQVDSQYDGDQYNGGLSTQEDLKNNTATYFDLSGGINYRFQHPAKRTRLDVGVAMYHVNEPNQSFFADSDVRLERRVSLYGVGNFGIGRIFDLGLQAIGQLQGPHEELLVSAYGKLYIDQRPDKELSLSLGVAHRINDAWAPYLIVDYRMWSFGISYDINSSPFKLATSRRGGPELSLIYIFTKVRPPREFEICPIF